MDTPITQSREWQQLQNDLGESSFYVQEENYHFLAILKDIKVGKYLYCPYGPVLEDETSLKPALEALKRLAREQGAVFIRIEPMALLTPQFLRSTAQAVGFSVKKVKDISPKDTWVLDLSPDQATLISGFSQGTRTRYNTYRKKGLSVEHTTDPDAIKHLVALQNKLYRSKHLHAFSAKYLATELAQPFASLYLVRYHSSLDQNRQPDRGDYPADGQVLAASLFFDYADTRYYMQSAADGEYKRLPATVALLTAALFDAKEQGIKKFDFWGIAPDGADSSHPWAGFTEFKKSFGGAARHYTGTYDLILDPAKYRLFTTLQSLRRHLRH